MHLRLENNFENWQTDSFPQSWAWGDILLAEGKQVNRITILNDEGVVVGRAQLVYEKLPFGWQYAFCPKGPVLEGPTSKEPSSAKALEDRQETKAIDCLAEYLQKNNCLFFRFEPISPLTQLQATSYKLQASLDINPRTTTVLNLTKPLDELLARMHQKTRYNIRLAEKKGLEISSTKKYSAFIELMKKTGARDGFRLHHEKHYQTIFAAAASRQLTAVYEGKNIATAVFVGSGKTFTYLYGASDHEYRALMAPYLLQWEGIKLGKDLGYDAYDFFGIAPSLKEPPYAKASEDRQGAKNKEQNDNTPTVPLEGEVRYPPRGGAQGVLSDRIENPGPYSYDQNHQYAGVTRFKLGFGGEVVELPGTFDLILKPLQYRIYQLLRKLRRWF